MHDRCAAAGLVIDRSTFFHIRDKAVRRGFDGFERISSRHEAATYSYGQPDSFRDILGLRWTLDPGGMINVVAFSTTTSHRSHHYEAIDIRSGTRLRAQRRYLVPRRPLSSAVRASRSSTSSRLSRQGRKRIKAELPAGGRRWPQRWNATM